MLDPGLHQRMEGLHGASVTLNTMVLTPESMLTLNIRKPGFTSKDGRVTWRSCVVVAQISPGFRLSVRGSVLTLV